MLCKKNVQGTIAHSNLVKENFVVHGECMRLVMVVFLSQSRHGHRGSCYWMVVLWNVRSLHSVDPIVRCRHSLGFADAWSMLMLLWTVLRFSSICVGLFCHVQQLILYTRHFVPSEPQLRKPWQIMQCFQHPSVYVLSYCFSVEIVWGTLRNGYLE